MGMFHFGRMTCRHFRYQVPREYADELRDADPEPCPVCDGLPHRRAQPKTVPALDPLQRCSLPQVAKSRWRVRLFGDRQEESMPGTALPVPARAIA
jgi:hypothetical protein